MEINSIDNKLAKLRDFLKKYGKVAVAFSGGVDSALLAYIVHDTLGASNSIALTASTQLIPKSDLEEAKSIASDIGIVHKFVNLDVLESEDVAANPPDRCYFCKSMIFNSLLEMADKKGFSILVDGSNADDTAEYRPGMKAISELGMRSPLLDAGLTKEEIRQLSRQFGIDGAERPASPCLSTRIPYGTRLEKSVLDRVEASEGFMKEIGFDTVRVRIHDDIARIEIPPAVFEKFLVQRDLVTSKLREMGFTYVTLDLEGFKSGSMNKSILENVNGD